MTIHFDYDFIMKLEIQDHSYKGMVYLVNDEVVTFGKTKERNCLLSSTIVPLNTANGFRRIEVTKRFFCHASNGKHVWIMEGDSPEDLRDFDAEWYTMKIYPAPRAIFLG